MDVQRLNLAGKLIETAGLEIACRHIGFWLGLSVEDVRGRLLSGETIATTDFRYKMTEIGMERYLRNPK